MPGASRRVLPRFWSALAWARVPLVPPASETPPLPRRPAVELLRIIAAFGVVWYHCGIEGSRFGYAGLIVFLVLSAYFWGLHYPQRAFHWPRQARRLLSPWLLWSLFYGFIALFRSQGLKPFPNGWPATLLIGPVIHLWYLPFVFVSIVMLDSLGAMLGPKARVLFAFGAAALLASSSGWGQAARDMGAPVSQYLFALVPTLFGATAGLLDQAGQGRGGRTAVIALIVLAGVSALQPGSAVDWSYPIGMAAAVACLAWRGPPLAAPLIDSVARCALGIYLLHPFFLLYLHKYHWVSGPAMPLLTFAASLATILCLKRWFPRLAAWTT